MNLIGFTPTKDESKFSAWQGRATHPGETLAPLKPAGQEQQDFHCPRISSPWLPMFHSPSCTLLNASFLFFFLLQFAYIREKGS